MNKQTTEAIDVLKKYIEFNTNYSTFDEKAEEALKELKEEEIKKYNYIRVLQSQFDDCSNKWARTISEKRKLEDSNKQLEEDTKLGKAVKYALSKYKDLAVSDKELVVNDEGVIINLLDWYEQQLKENK